MIKGERPLLEASIFYYDSTYSSERAEKVLQTLKKYGMFPPEKIYADKLTGDKFVFADDSTEELFIKAYSEKDVLGVDMASGDSLKEKEYRRVSMSFTFHKLSEPTVKKTAFEPWNVITLYYTYGQLKDEKILSDCLGCVRELILLLRPFYARIDDVANTVALTKKPFSKTVPAFAPDKVQRIFWGNYFGREHCEKYGYDMLLNLPAAKTEKLGDGVFFTLSDKATDNKTAECFFRRMRIESRLHIK